MKALLSVYDKTKIDWLAEELEKAGWDILSTGGTARYLKEKGIDVTEVSDVTEFPEILGGRVKTLHPKIHGGILYRRGADDKEIEDLEIPSIDMVVNNLYPFEACLKEGKDRDEMIENIDIGGPSMIRAAAKNYKDVIVLTDPGDYESVIEKLNDGGLTEDDRMELARKAFSETAMYDSLIASWFNGELGVRYPEVYTEALRKKDELRYGENPHQKAAFYEYCNPAYTIDYRVLHGKKLSYNNLNDMYGAIRINKEFSEPCAVAVKHTNPCGIGTGKTPAEAFKKCWECDTDSIFGGIIVINREIDKECAEMLSQIFLEIVIAPSFSDEAMEILTRKKNIRLIEIPEYRTFDMKSPVIKEVINGFNMQDYDKRLFMDNELNIVTKRKPTEDEMNELLFAWKAVKNVASNGVVITKDGGTLGIGQGETKRSWAVEEAVERAGDKIDGAVFASDGFFFADTMEILDKAGIKAIIQPGGSVKDEEVIEYADAHDMSIVFTNIRHFRH